MGDDPIRVERPLVIIYEDAEGIVFRIYPSKKANSHKRYGMLICDLVRHAAKAFNVEEDDVWEWVDKERRHPTTPITRLT
jgi:hypothetical protein